MTEPSDERRELYERFINEVRKEDVTLFYDEDDLIEVFDYASDMHDDFAKIEVLMLAARLFPESVPLKERKAWFHFDLGNAEAARDLALSLPANSVMRRLLLLYIDRPEPAEARKRLDEIISVEGEFEDEWLIDLVEVASELGCYGWLKEAQTRIAAKTPYPQTFYYEMVDEAEQNDDIPTAIALAEELTMLEPFNADFWELLARLHGPVQKDYASALTDIDYSLAIRPDSVRALMLKADAMLELHYKIDDIAVVLDKALELEPDNSSVVMGKAVALWTEGYNQEATALLETYRRRNPEDTAVLLMMLRATGGMMQRELLKPIFSGANSPDDFGALNEWIKEARELASEGNIGAAATYLSAMADFTAMRPLGLLMEYLYRAGRYSEVIDAYATHIHSLSSLEECEPSVPYLYVLARLRVNRLDGLSGKITDILTSMPDMRNENFSIIMAYTTMVEKLKAIREVLNEGKKIPFEKIDVFQSNS